MNRVTEGAFEVTQAEGGFWLETTEIHTGPLHLPLSLLQAWGIRPRDPAAWARLPPSEVLRRWSKLRLPPDLEPYGPAVTDPTFRSARGLEVLGFRLVAVREGLDVYVDDYDVEPLRVAPAHLSALGLTA